MAFYAVLKHDTREDTIHVFKCPTASDPNTITNWTSQATYVLDGDVKSIWVVVHDSDLHIAVAGVRQRNQGNFGFVKYLRYDVGADAIDIDEEHATVFGGTGEALYFDFSITIDPVTLIGTSIAVRSDGDVVVLYTGLNSTKTNWLTYYSRREGGSWTRGIQVPTSVTQTQVAGVAVLGASDLTHFFWSDRADNQVEHRSLSSANSLGTVSVVDSAAALRELGVVNAITFNDGTARVRVLYEDANGQLSAAYGNDQTNPSWTAEADASDNDVLVLDESPIADLVLDGQVSHLIYSEDLSSDIFIDENDGIGGWGTDTEEQDGVTCNAISANVYDRSGIKLAYLWDDAGTTKYDEVDLGAAPGPPIPPLILRPKENQLRRL